MHTGEGREGAYGRRKVRCIQAKEGKVHTGEGREGAYGRRKGRCIRAKEGRGFRICGQWTRRDSLITDVAESQPTDKATFLIG